MDSGKQTERNNWTLKTRLTHYSGLGSMVTLMWTMQIDKRNSMQSPLYNIYNPSGKPLCTQFPILSEQDGSYYNTQAHFSETADQLQIPGKIMGFPQSTS